MDDELTTGSRTGTPLLRCASAVLALALSIAASSVPAQEADNTITLSLSALEEFSERDPLEPLNRAIFGLNQRIHEPLADAWQYLVSFPSIQRLVPYGDNVLSNLREPVNVINQLLIGDLDGASHSVNRFAINSTLGVVGVWDVAKEKGLERSKISFVDVVCYYHVPPGPFWVWPLFGGGVLRDSAAWILAIVAGYELLGEPVLYVYIYRILDRVEGDRPDDKSPELMYLRDGVADGYAAYRAHRISTTPDCGS